MKREEFREELVKDLEQMGISISEEQVGLFYCYMELLLEWNEKMNLTAITDPKEIIVKHFVDCSTVLKELEESKRIIDIGTGAGFPGVVIKILRPNLPITLVDSLNKRIIFLEEVIKTLKLEKVELIHARVEDLARQKEYREQFDYIVSRAVAPLNVLLEYMIPFLKVGGKCICMKGSNVEEEISNAKEALNILSGEISSKKEIILPELNLPRNILEIEKKKVTPKTYPRKAGKPSKEPII